MDKDLENIYDFIKETKKHFLKEGKINNNKKQHFFFDSLDDFEKEFFSNLTDERTYQQAIVLYAKQISNVEATTILIEKERFEEAYILTRSVLNNLFLIHYLTHDCEQKKRLKNFLAQAILNPIKILEARIILKNTIDYEIEQTEKEIKEEIKKLKNLLKEQKITRHHHLGISELVDGDICMKNIYKNYYTIGCQYEHSDPRVLLNYIDKHNSHFIINTNKRDEELKQPLIDMIEISLSASFLEIIKYAKNKKLDIFEEDEGIDGAMKVYNTKLAKNRFNRK